MGSIVTLSVDTLGHSLTDNMKIKKGLARSSCARSGPGAKPKAWPAPSLLRPTWRNHLASVKTQLRNLSAPMAERKIRKCCQTTLKTE